MNQNSQEGSPVGIIQTSEHLRSSISSLAELVIVRHGQTEWNEVGKFNSHTDLELATLGKDECLIASNNFKTITEQNSVVFSSPKLRCLQTASILFPNLEISVDENLREMDFGEFEGRNPHEIQESSDRNEFKIWRSDNNDEPVLGVEKIERVLERANTFFQNPNLTGKSVFIVTHGVFARITTLAMIGFDPHRYRSIRLDNCKYARIQMEAGKPRLTALNCCNVDGFS